MRRQRLGKKKKTNNQIGRGIKCQSDAGERKNTRKKFAITHDTVACQSLVQLVVVGDDYHSNGKQKAASTENRFNNNNNSMQITANNNVQQLFNVYSWVEDGNKNSLRNENVEFKWNFQTFSIALSQLMWIDTGTKWNLNVSLALGWPGRISHRLTKKRVVLRWRVGLVSASCLSPFGRPNSLLGCVFWSIWFDGQLQSRDKTGICFQLIHTYV